MGAQVVKVERPGDGDPARTAGPFPDDVPHPEKGGLHLYLNMGKKSITLDLASPRGRDLLWRLVEVSDVLVEGFAPGTMERWGSPYSSLREVNPQLIMASVTNFGQTGPYKGYKATEIVLRALSGELHLQGMQDKPPLMKGSHLAQYQGGLHALISVMAALYTRGRLGHGQHIDVSMTEGWASVAGGSFKGYTYKKQVPKRGSGHTAQLPGGLRRCKDGWVVLGARGGRREWWPSFVNMIDLPVLREERFSTEEGRSAHMEELETIYTQWLSRHTREEVYNKAQTSRLAAAYVADAEDLLNSPQLRSRDYYQQVDHPPDARLSLSVEAIQDAKGGLA